MGKKSGTTRNDLDEADALEHRLFCHTHKLRRYSYTEIAKLATDHFGRPFTPAKVSRLCAVEATERMALDTHIAERLRYEITVELDGLALIVSELLTPTYVDHEGATWSRKTVDRLAAVREYRGLLQDRAKLLGLNAAERIEATVVHVTPQDPAVQALIAEAEHALTEGHR